MRDREEKDQNNGRGLFYGVIGVATLIVAIIGATFAWFTATATGDAVTVQSGTLTIEYTNGTQVHATNLKPATTAQVLQYKDTCIITGEEASTEPAIAAEQICAAYTFSVKNTGSLRAVMSGSVDSITNTYPAGVIKYVLVPSATVTSTDLASASTFTGTFTMPSNVSLAPGDTKSYTLLIWLDESASNEPGENNASGKTLSGTLRVTANQTNYVDTTP